ncbi:MAG: preprotein translocase subunit YajC [Methylococcaceae bacterium]|nr:preprotein translocase subunit YajC [Methylococcaceae bacterium]
MDFFISNVYAAAPAEDPAIVGLLFPVAILLVFYFLFIRPQQKRAKEHKSLVSSLNRGAEVVTNGGLLGKVVDLDENFVRIEVSENTFVQVQRNAIASLMPKGTYRNTLKKINKQNQ